MEILLKGGRNFMGNKRIMYDADYFERGVETGKSLYQNYRWLPELTTSLAMSYVDYLGLTRGHKILDYGCAKGFIVKALRILHRQAWGVDISEYVVNSADNETRKYLKLSTMNSFGNGVIPFDFNFDYILSKDVFEHLTEQDLSKVLQVLCKKSKMLFAVVPLGKNGKFVIPAYDLDKTHILARDKDWWIKEFKKNGWKLKEFSYYVPGIKESWKNFEKGNGFFLLKK